MQKLHVISDFNFFDFVKDGAITVKPTKFCSIFRDLFILQPRFHRKCLEKKGQVADHQNFVECNEWLTMFCFHGIKFRYNFKTKWVTAKAYFERVAR